jgi:glycosyltransferase involved in cell wall biosynthesis
MKIGFLAYGFERPNPLSMVSYTLELANALHRVSQDVEITLLTTAAQGRTRVPEHFRSVVLPACKRLPALMTIGNAAVAAAAHTLDLDIVHDPVGVAPFLLRPFYGKTRTLVTVHDLVSYVYPQTHTSLTNILQKVWLPLGLKSATAVVTVSQHSKADLCRHLALDQQKVAVVPCGVHSRFSPNTTPGERARLAERYNLHGPYILYLGDVQARKNVVGLLEAFARMRRSLPGYTLVIAGAPTWKYEAIYATVDRLDLRDAVLFTGYVADADVPALYRQAELFVFPSLYEGFGRPPLEAMACGTPVVTSHSSSLPEVVGDAALLVDPHDSNAIAEAMHRVLDSPTLAATLRDRGIARARRFTWERAAQDMLTLYEHVLCDRHTQYSLKQNKS